MRLSNRDSSITLLEAAPVAADASDPLVSAFFHLFAKVETNQTVFCVHEP